MANTLIGYSLVYRANGFITQTFTSVPGRLDLPNGDVVFGAFPGWISSSNTFTLANRLLLTTPPSQPFTITNETDVFDGTNVNITQTYQVIPPSPPAPVFVLKSDIVQRLITANLIANAVNYINNSNLAFQQSWLHSTQFDSSNINIITLLITIGADVQTILFGFRN